VFRTYRAGSCGWLDYTLQGRATWLKPRSRDVYAKAVDLFERALVLDAGSIEAQSWLATELASRALDGLTDTPAADIARAEELAAKHCESSAENTANNSGKTARAPLYFSRSERMNVRISAENLGPLAENF
jgi:hypothetical protein